MELIRYVIQMRNGNYMAQEFLDGLDRVKIETVDLPIDADLFKSKTVAERVIEQMLNGESNLPVFYEDENPPERVIKVKMKINFEV